MSSRWASAHENTRGAGDARPTALQIVEDEGLRGKLTDKVILITGCSSGLGVETVHDALHLDREVHGAPDVVEARHAQPAAGQVAVVQRAHLDRLAAAAPAPDPGGETPPAPVAEKGGEGA